MASLLIYPPFADPTQPYVSLPTLKGFLRSRGLNAVVRDVNVEAAHHLLSPTVLAQLLDQLDATYASLDSAPSLALFPQLQYKALATARAGLVELIDADVSPVAVFQRAELFFDPVRYTAAQRQTMAMFDALSAVNFPHRFDFNQAANGWLAWSFDALRRYCSDGRSPLDGFYRQTFADVDADFIGLTVVFPSQLPEAFYLCHVFRELAPNAFIALGGPTLHQAVVHMPERLKRRLFEWVDGVGLYEGEETLAQLLPRLQSWRESRAEPLAASESIRNVPNLLTLDPATGATRQGPAHLMDLRTAACPDYSDLNLDSYLAPSRRVLYAPTRGCYWDKCSFCYYGLSETATASYREVPPAQAAIDLARLQADFGVTNIYISCDVLSPSYAVRLADALIAAKVDIRWSSDLKIERYYNQERCQRLYDSGLRAAAFGIESGSDRILTLMRKGCDRQTMSDVNRTFHRAGVATEWMTFTGHPDETGPEALSTIDWIKTDSDAIASFIVGDFGLQPGSHIAKNPELYGVRAIYFTADDDFRLYAQFKTAAKTVSDADQARLADALTGVSAGYRLSPYPWAGAVSSHHTFLHLVRSGPRALRQHFRNVAMHGEPRQREGRYSIARIDAALHRFNGTYWKHALEPQPTADGTLLAAHSEHTLVAAATGMPSLRPGKSRANIRRRH